MKDVTSKLETLVHQDAFEEALSKLKKVEPQTPTAADSATL